ncbi:Retrovirus-related Pol polyprotein from transposon RE1-like protein [Drosera capensis]
MVREFTQQYAFDYKEAFSPVAKLNIVRVLVSLAVHYSWPLYQLDIKNVFLHGDLTETVYILQPPRYETVGENRMCRLRKSLYEVKQSPRAWFEKFSKIVQAIGFSRSSADFLLFVHRRSQGSVILLIYIDGIIITEDDRVGIINVKVGSVSQFMHTPRKSHLTAVEHILRYLKKFPGRDLHYRSTTTPSLTSYTDDDYAGPLDDRHSTNDYCTYFGGNLITWRAKKQTIVARSSAKTEYRVMALATSELTCLKRLLSELDVQLPNPLTLYCDNKVVIHIAENPVFHERIKHIEINFHFIHENIQQRIILLQHISTDTKL